MPDPVLCTRCQAVVLEEVTDVGVRPVGGDEIIPFRRTTDYVVCAQCFTTYSVRDLIGARATGDEPGGDAEVVDLIEHLERLAEEPPETSS